MEDHSSGLPELPEPEKVNWELLDTFRIKTVDSVVRIRGRDSYCLLEAVEGDPASRVIAEAQAREYLREDLLRDSRFFHARWRVACRLAKRLKGVVVEKQRIKTALRDGWVRLLPGTGSIDDYTPAGLRVHIATMGNTKRTLFDGFLFFRLDDPKNLIAIKNTPQYKLAKIPWDRIVEIALHYTNPPTDFTVESRSKALERSE